MTIQCRVGISITPGTNTRIRTRTRTTMLTKYITHMGTSRYPHHPSNMHTTPSQDRHQFERHGEPNRHGSAPYDAHSRSSPFHSYPHLPDPLTHHQQSSSAPNTEWFHKAWDPMDMHVNLGHQWSSNTNNAPQAQQTSRPESDNNKHASRSPRAATSTTTTTTTKSNINTTTPANAQAKTISPQASGSIIDTTSKR